MRLLLIALGNVRCLGSVRAAGLGIPENILDAQPEHVCHVQAAPEPTGHFSSLEVDDEALSCPAHHGQLVLPEALAFAFFLDEGDECCSELGGLARDAGLARSLVSVQFPIANFPDRSALA